MRPVNWLHISDFHLRESESWSQDSVLSAMLRDVKCRCDAGLKMDFVLVTGDLTFSGEKSQYDLVEAFFLDLAGTIGLPCSRIFCVPGNHDVQRGRQKSCFRGARQGLQSENDVYAFLSDVEERETLLQRQENYCRFQGNFFSDQVRQKTDDNLAYVSAVEIEDLVVAIIGLNSAWLSEGGEGDERRLLLGEHQVEHAISITRELGPHIIIGMQHHPFDFLMRYDQRSTQYRLEEACHFLHCGHLHESQATEVANHSGHCLTLVAGASFASRKFRNAYTLVTLDPFHAQTHVTFVQYDPTAGAFSYESTRLYAHEIDAATDCPVGELAKAVEHYCCDAMGFSSYLASLLLGDVSDVPIQTNDTVAFGTLDLLKRQLDGDLLDLTIRFLALGRAIKLLYGHKPMAEILEEHGEPLLSYARFLITLSATDANLMEQLKMRNNDAGKLAVANSASPFHHTLELMDDLLEAGEWESLREVAERSCKLDEPSTAAKGQRILALCLARSSENSDRRFAAELYTNLIATPYGNEEDLAALATILTDEGEHGRAKETVLQGILAYPGKLPAFVEIGMKIVSATGDIDFRDLLRASGGNEKTI